MNILFPTLETARLKLRPFKIEDAGRVQELAGSYEVAKTTLNIPHPYGNGIAEQWISTHQQQFIDLKGITFCIEMKENNEIVGAIGLEVDQRHKRAEMGYWIGIPYWGRGICTEASIRVIEYGFSNLGCHKILGFHLKSNPASGKVMQKSGMEFEGTFKDYFFKDGEFLTVDAYSIIRSE